MGLCFSDKLRMNRGAPPPDVVTAFVEYTEGRNHMTAEQLCRFLVEAQDETEVLVSDAEKIIERITCERHHITKFLRHTLNLDDFFSFLFSDDLNHSIDSKVSSFSSLFFFLQHGKYQSLRFYCFRCIKTWPLPCPTISFTRAIIRI